MYIFKDRIGNSVVWLFSAYSHVFIDTLAICIVVAVHSRT